MNRVLRSTTLLVQDIRSEYAPSASEAEPAPSYGEEGFDFDFRTLLNNEAVQDKIDALLYQYKQVVDFLREKKERLVLLQTLHAQG